MPSRLRDAIKRANRTRAPEDSIKFRVLVMGAVLTGTATLASQSAVSFSTFVAISLILPLAYLTSYVRRGKDNWHIKIVLAVAALVALSRFLRQVGAVSTLDEVRFPLADVFLWVQVLHSFDLPARKDLNFSLGSSLALMAVAGSLSQDLWFGVFLVIYVCFVGAALIQAHRSEMVEGTVAVTKTKGSPRGGATFRFRQGLGGVAIIAITSVVMFLITPQPSGLRTFALPFNVGGGGGLFSGGTVTNPGFGDFPGLRSNGTGYFGFGTNMDLSVRGSLSDEVVMRVRASSPAMWRGIIFDEYDGRSWSSPESDFEQLDDGLPMFYPIRFRSLGPRYTITQTFYIETDQPNIIFAASQPDRIWHYDIVSTDRYGSLRTDATITADSVYSVVSSRGAATPDELRAADPTEIELLEEFDPFLQVSPSVTERTKRLARSITRSAPTTYDKVKAIERYLADNFEYNTDSPVPPEGQDAVDHFLFDTDVGFCEQFASATVIMLRTLGIPARVVGGFTPGNRNAFTGYYEVKNSDAHTWVEVFFPGLGWYEFDPTFDVPAAGTEVAELFPLLKAIEFIVAKVGALFPGGSGGMIAKALFAAAVMAIVIWSAIVIRSRLRRRVVAAPATQRAPPTTPIARALFRLEQALAAKGVPRAPGETARELLRRRSLVALAAAPPVAATRAFERERYSERPPEADEERKAVADLDRLTSGVAQPGERE